MQGQKYWVVAGAASLIAGVASGLCSTPGLGFDCPPDNIWLSEIVSWIWLTNNVIWPVVILP
jgi:hypothetical protein